MNDAQYSVSGGRFDIGARADAWVRTVNLLRDESGAVLILVALMMVVFLGLVALVVDGGDLFTQQRDLQTAADSGALAGALALAHGEDWSEKASNFLEGNRAANPNFSADSVWLSVKQIDGPKITGPDGIERGGVRVTLHEKGVRLFFAPFLDEVWKDGGEVGASAAAGIKALISVNDIFPIMGKYYIERLRVRLRPVGTEPSQGDPKYYLTEGAADEGYATWGKDFTAPPTGVYWVTLEAVDDEENVYARWADIGRLDVRDPASTTPYVYDLTRPLHSNTVTVRIAARDDVSVSRVTSSAGNVTLASLPVELEPGWNLWTATITPSPDFREPPYGNSTNSYEAVRVSFRTRSLPPGPPNHTDYNDVARFPDFHKEDGDFDVPVIAFSMPTTILPLTPLSAEATATAFEFGQPFQLKVKSNINDTQGGTRNSANVWDGVGLVDEIVDGFSPDRNDWEPVNSPLQIGNKLAYESGSTVGQINGGWSQRYLLSGFDNSDRLGPGDFDEETVPDIAPNDPNFIIVPLVYYRNLDDSLTYHDSRLGEITLTGGEYRIAMFAGLYVTTDPSDTNNATIDGYFIRSLAQGESVDVDPDEEGLYIQTVVLTE